MPETTSHKWPFVTLLLLGCLFSNRVIADDSGANLLAEVQSAQDRAQKEAILSEFAGHFPNGGSELLYIARTTHDDDTEWLAIRQIGTLKYRAAEPFLTQALHSQSHYVRANAARALGDLGDVAAVPELMEILGPEQDSGVIEQTSLALRMLHAHEAVPLLKSKASNPSPQTRMWVLQAVDELGSKADVPFFASFLFDKNEAVAELAAIALQGRVGQDFGVHRCGNGPCNYQVGGVKEAQAWWAIHKQDWKQLSGGKPRAALLPRRYPLPLAGDKPL